MAEFTKEMVAAMVAASPLNWVKAQEMEGKGLFKDVTARGIVASAKRNEIPYNRQERVSKTGSPVASKSDLVEKIAVLMDLDAADLDGLDKATKSPLEKIAAFLEPQED